MSTERRTCIGLGLAGVLTVAITSAMLPPHRAPVAPNVAETTVASAAPSTESAGSTSEQLTFFSLAVRPGESFVVHDTRLRATLVIATDAAAMPFRLESPIDGARWGTTLSIRGTTLPGTDMRVLTYRGIESRSELRDVAIDRVTLRVDSAGRFSEDIPTPQTGILVIETRHPSHGTHYFLRRAWHAGGIAQPGEID